MTPVEITLLLIAVALYGVCCFLLGYDAAESRERRALKFVRQREQALESWVKSRWPNQYEAHKLGHAEGYQQGVLQGPELDDGDDETSP